MNDDDHLIGALRTSWEVWRTPEKISIFGQVDKATNGGKQEKDKCEEDVLFLSLSLSLSLSLFVSFFLQSLFDFVSKILIRRP